MIPAEGSLRVTKQHDRQQPAICSFLLKASHATQTNDPLNGRKTKRQLKDPDISEGRQKNQARIVHSAWQLNRQIVGQSKGNQSDKSTANLCDSSVPAGNRSEALLDGVDIRMGDHLDKTPSAVLYGKPG